MGYTPSIRLLIDQGAVIPSLKPGDTAFRMAMVPATAQLCHSPWPPLQSNLNQQHFTASDPLICIGKNQKKKTGHTEGKRASIFSNKTSLL